MSWEGSTRISGRAHVHERNGSARNKQTVRSRSRPLSSRAELAARMGGRDTSRLPSIRFSDLQHAHERNGSASKYPDRFASYSSGVCKPTSGQFRSETLDLGFIDVFRDPVPRRSRPSRARWGHVLGRFHANFGSGARSRAKRQRSQHANGSRAIAAVLELRRAGQVAELVHGRDRSWPPSIGISEPQNAHERNGSLRKIRAKV